MKRHYIPYNLYPEREPSDKSTKAIRSTHPTISEFQAAESALLDCSQFTLIDHGRLVLYEIDKSNDKKHKFIAYIPFTRSSNLPEKEIDNLNFLTKFLITSRSYISSVNSLCKIFSGRMCSIVWRKSQTEGEMAGCYLDSMKIFKDPIGYLKHLMDGFSASNIIYNLFHSIADTAVQGVKTLLPKLKLAAFCQL